MIKWGMNSLNGADYETVAVIGSQSSGKSTSLNNVFGTDFVVMNPEARGPTTEGIWVSRDKVHNIVVMDVEGSDGAARGDAQNFERQSALFALACSRLLIVNIWENQVGLYNGANMGLLKIVFEEHISMYGNLDKRVYQWPKIVFIIQAHSSGTSLANLAHTLLLDLDRVWESITKPEELMSKTLSEYFDFEFASLPNLHLDSGRYKSEVGLLRKRFVERDSVDYILKHAHPNTISAEGLEPYMRMIWETILLNENLNLPGQHELLARAMCDKISKSLIEKYAPEIASQLAILNEGKVINGLGSLMQGWKSDIFARYDEEARRYTQSANAEKRAALIHSFHNEVTKLFGRQLQNHRLSLLASFDEIMEEAVGKEDPEFLAISSDTKHRLEEDFTTAARNTVIDDAQWDWEREFEELQSGLVDRIKACRKERSATDPIRATKDELVNSGRWITTKATLYRDGKLVVEAYTSSVHALNGLRGRILIVVKDKHGNAIGMTNELRCTTRGGALDPFTDSSGDDLFVLKFPRDVGRRAAGLDIYQGNKSLAHTFAFFWKLTQIIAGVL
ncbi:root hair defective 3 GTP-binding protein-domain-containing protein [Mycena galopus ATCC 62051]|nr:root hair defective 3 GTP-binding protein-domain-containing protein [Mycena galopus ATCC 62051]